MLAKHFAVLAAVCAVLAPGPVAAQKPGEGGAGGTITIQVCNNSNNHANVAISYQPVGTNQFYNEGWYTVNSRTCRDIATTDNAYFYGYAEVVNAGSTYWSGNHGLCVIYPGPYEFWDNNSQYCDNGQEVRNFVVLHAEQYGVYTWTLDP